MIESTFQLGRGFGPRREQQLWRAGVASWSDVAATSPSSMFERRLRAAIDEAACAYRAGDIERLASLLPAREHWRLFGAFAGDAAYLDIETSDDVIGHCGISAIGLLDRDGPRLLLAGRDLARFPRISSRWKLLVTFNGGSFDVPILRRAFPEWTPPACHIDLRHVLQRLGLGGGLKSIERRLPALHLRRPPHLDGIGGWDACSLYRRGRDGDGAALRRFAEYNLYDTINLRTLMAYAYNRMIDTLDVPGDVARVPVPERGDVLYDVSKILLEL